MMAKKKKGIKLTQEIADDIRRRHFHNGNYSNAAELAKEFNVSRGTIENILQNKTWVIE
jgi:DNA-binding GntR family transcriptional regulator